MKKILILITALFLLQGCSSNSSYTNDQLQNLTNSVKISQLDKTEFDTKNVILIKFIKNTGVPAEAPGVTVQVRNLRIRRDFRYRARQLRRQGA